MSRKTLTDAVCAQITQDIISGVGYRRPPQHSRFQKGQSGNPKGRPRKDKNKPAPFSAHPQGSNAAVLSRVLAEDVHINRNGKRRKISKAEFVQRNTEKQAAEGSILATRDLRQQLLTEDVRRHQEIEDNHDLFKRYLEARAQDIARTSAAGLPPSRFWFDPDDVLFHPGRLVEVRGPLEQAEVPGFERIATFIQIRMVEWYGRLLSGYSSSEADELAPFQLMLLLRFMPAQLARDCMACWDSLADAPLMPWPWFIARRTAIWKAAGFTPPRRFLPPLTLSPQAERQLKAIIADTIPPFQQELINLVTKHRRRRKPRR